MMKYTIKYVFYYVKKGTSRQRSGKCAIRKRFLLQKPRWEKLNYQLGTYTMKTYRKKSTSRQRSGKGAIRKRLPLQKPRWEKTKLTIRHLYHENTS